jgi:23S rRNA G2445 N2-methylase RlmL
MKRYYSTFITGFEDVIEEELVRRLRGVVIEIMLDGGVVYQTNLPLHHIIDLRFFNNSFILYDLLEIRDTDPIQELAGSVLSNSYIQRVLARDVPYERGSFRVIVSCENRLVALNDRLMHAFERKIIDATNLTVNRGRPDFEYWLMSRSEGYGIFGLRITRHRDYARTLQRGELRPEFAHILCVLSEPSASDVFLDPFCGSGAIPIERARSFPYSKVMATDLDADVIYRLRRRARIGKYLIDISEMDARSMLFPDSTIDRIVTDPPWGYFDNGRIDLHSLYRYMLEEFCRVIRISGVIIVVVANKELFEEIAEEFENYLIPIRRFDTLISGKKAGVYKFERIDRRY